jgi:endonuclease-3
MVDIRDIHSKNSDENISRFLQPSVGTTILYCLIKTQKTEKPMSKPTRLLKIIQKLEQFYGVEKKDWELAPFPLLVNVVLSQHTNDINSGLAFERLQQVINPMTPQAILDNPPSTIQTAIKPAGLWRIKTKRLKEIAETVITEHQGDLRPILLSGLPLQEARKSLLDLPGVGEKTADILLLFKGNYPVFPLDTHCLRLSVRLGFIATSKKYDAVRLVLQEQLPSTSDMMKRSHLIIITHGRQICKAITPECYRCPIVKLCPYEPKTRTKKS